MARAGTKRVLTVPSMYLSGGAQRRKKEIERELLTICISAADSLPRLRFGIEQEQVNAVHRIPRVQKIMDGNRAITIEVYRHKTFSWRSVQLNGIERKNRSVVNELFGQYLVMHREIEPSILYFGTPVVVISTLNTDGTTNIAPISSAWWLSWNCMLGLGASSQTSKNLLRERQCVINLPSMQLVGAVNRLAKLTGVDPVPEHKQAMGYRYESNKFQVAGLTGSESNTIRPQRILECPVQLEAILENAHPFGHGPDRDAGCWAFEVRVVRVHIEASLIVPGTDNHIDPDKWRPLVMSFRRFYGLTGQIHESRLAEIPEEAYRPAQHMN